MGLPFKSKYLAYIPSSSSFPFPFHVTMNLSSKAFTLGFSCLPVLVSFISISFPKSFPSNSKLFA
ncbi:MAG: hypothetical protein ACK4IX_03555 [Candidatus Sericytochromatia bacterium]